MPCVEMDYGQCRRVLSFWSVMESHIYSSISRDESDWRFFRAQIALSYQEKRARPPSSEEENRARIFAWCHFWRLLWTNQPYNHTALVHA